MLTDAHVRKIKPLEKKKRYADEKGLYLEVTPSGGRFWRLKYRFNGRESTLTIGSYPEISLAQAHAEMKLVYSFIKILTLML